jgi:hypothetical protein
VSNSRLNRQPGDAHLDPRESVIRQREELLAKREAHKPYGQAEIQDAGRSLGPRLHYSELVLKLKKLCPRLTVRDGIPGNLALYRPKTEAEMAADGYDLSVPEWYNESKYLTGFPKGHVPEWGHYTLDTDGVAEREVRGWRSILIAFVKQGVCTYAEAVAEFGDPVDDQRSRFWFEQLNPYRQGKEGGNAGN